MSSFTKREQIVILVFVVVIVMTLCYNLFNNSELNVKKANGDEPSIDNETIENEIESEKNDEDLLIDKEERKVIMVDISGQVNYPGLVQLYDGDRVIDAVNKAGGLKPECDRKRVNLAKKVNDEEKIYIPKIGEILDNEIENIIDMSNNLTESKGKININRASKEELIELPGIGEVLAERIIQYRTESMFENIEEITQVSGVGDKKYEEIKDYITVK